MWEPRPLEPFAIQRFGDGRAAAPSTVAARPNAPVSTAIAVSPFKT
jgi:hypothetical protein